MRSVSWRFLVSHAAFTVNAATAGADGVFSYRLTWKVRGIPSVAPHLTLLLVYARSKVAVRFRPLEWRCRMDRDVQRSGASAWPTVMATFVFVALVVSLLSL